MRTLYPFEEHPHWFFPFPGEWTVTPVDGEVKP
jgi:hypothetical protein